MKQDVMRESEKFGQWRLRLQRYKLSMKLEDEAIIDFILQTQGLVPTHIRMEFRRILLEPTQADLANILDRLTVFDEMYHDESSIVVDPMVGRVSTGPPPKSISTAGSHLRVGIICRNCKNEGHYEADCQGRCGGCGDAHHTVGRCRRSMDTGKRNSSDRPRGGGGGRHGGRHFDHSGFEHGGRGRGPEHGGRGPDPSGHGSDQGRRVFMRGGRSAGGRRGGAELLHLRMMRKM